MLNPQAKLRPAFKAVALPDASLDDYVGTYKLSEKMLITVFRMKDGLYARATGQAAIPIFASAPDEFFAKVGGVSATFMRDAAAAVTGLVLHQNDDKPAPKLSAAESPPEPKEIELDATALGEYVGKYKFDFGMLDVVLKGNHLEGLVLSRLSRYLQAAVTSSSTRLSMPNSSSSVMRTGMWRPSSCTRRDATCGRCAPTRHSEARHLSLQEIPAG